MTVVTTYLEMPSPDRLRPAAAPGPGVEVVAAPPDGGALNRRMYLEVGAGWSWNERRGWSAERWRNWTERPELEVWVIRERDEPAGYAELELQPGGEGAGGRDDHAGGGDQGPERGDAVEIVSLGLRPGFEGRGLGGHLLEVVTRRAWTMGNPTRRVWLHTCTLDSPAALPNYLARGFEVVRTVSSPS